MAMPATFAISMHQATGKNITAFWYLFQRQGVEILSFDTDTLIEGTGSLTVSADADSTVLKYAMLAKILLENFPDAVNYGAPNEKILSYNINLGQDIVIFFDYGEYGFESKGSYDNYGISRC